MMKSSLNLHLLLCGLALAGWCGASAQTNPPAQAAPPPSAPAKLSMADLEKLVAPIALYPDPLLATILPASVYPLEIVQAARFVADTNNLAKLDAQPWDENVKAVARVPGAIKKLNEDISWTIELGEAFLAQDKDIMDAIQSMRGKAQKAGTLQTTPQQTVTVTNMIVEKTIEQQVVVVTNTVVQIAPASSSVVYVPTYNPYTVYYPPPAYVYNPYAPLVTFGVGMAMGAIIANNCNWNNGGCYNNNNININNNNNNNFNRNNNGNRNPGGQQKWQPDQNRLNKSGSANAANRSAEARGYGSGGARPSTGNVGARPSTGTVGSRPSTGTAATRPSTGTGTARPSTGTVGSRPTTGTGNTGARPATGAAGAGQTSTWGGGSANRSAPAAGASQSRSAAPASRPASSGSAFSGTSSGAGARDASSRGSSSRGGGGGGSRGGGGGSRGGGGGGGRR